MATLPTEPGVPLLDRGGIAQKAAIEARHWWYRGRRRIVLAELDRLRLAPGAELLDAGCGSGHMLADLARFGRVTGAEAHPDAVEYARRRGAHDVEVAALEQLPFEDARFDAIACLDVLEHIADDARALRELRRVARPHARLLVTVPAYPRLWSDHDRAAGHARRYTRRTLERPASAAGWRLTRVTHFNALLLPVAVVLRGVRRRRPGAGTPRSDLLVTPRAVDGLLEYPLRAEAALLRSGVSLPFGLSLLAVFEADGA